ncbi:cyclin-like protein [Gloeophyllum trabeum ATCC 11539]|uniref:Cyclin-like protein n=1 Tax=Gloeophyllum trabeum (strain ATCC 11539 / FP-39264 / Madison 617) TaxID=670483 RepID=S7S4I0_GLOTA|nr:cyclin-like protein [Gloeophyllum trabeum ATCC 11539]EPQ60824.1 cyclin-like protein [Gloeophyllum trabeum ATCC 11539]
MPVPTEVASSVTPEPEPPRKRQRTLYEASTQYKNWRFSKQQLSSIRTSLNEAAVAAIRDTFEADSPGSSSDVSFLNADEERLLVKFYASKIPQLCGACGFPEEVEATAVSYLKRFYLKNTVMDWHPKNVMLTALFLATKTANQPIPIDAYVSRIPKTSPSDILDLEFLVAQSLGFEFTVWHPHRALWGVWLDIQSLPDHPKEDIEEVYKTAKTHVRASRLTDAELIYTPSQIALAAFSLASPNLASLWAHSKDSSNVLQVIEPLKQMILQDSHPPDVEAVRDVDRRLKLCKNPEKVIGSKAYLARKAQEEKTAAEKRAKKAEEIRKAMEENDPFGEHIADEKKLDEAVNEALEDDD